MKTPPVVSGLVVCFAVLASAQVGAPFLSPDTQLTHCWWSSDEIAAEDRAACEHHREYVMNVWRNHRSYYALLEIVEGRLQDGLKKMRREDVIDLLGSKNIDWDYPHSRRDGFLVWGSSRSLPMGSYLVVQFDKRGMAESYDWVSE